MINSKKTSHKPSFQETFSIGFRPFFLCATLFSFFAILAWVAVFLFGFQLSAFAYYPMNIWHAHEMIFGYSMAVIAGFLLTAIKNWTKIQTINGTKLMFLVGIWILARIIPFITDNGWIISLIDVLFLPSLAFFVALPLLQANNKRNYFMVLLILVFALLNSLIHLDLLGLLLGITHTVLQISLYSIIALVIIMAGRVFPMFSQNGVNNRYIVQKHAMIEKLAVPSFFIFAITVIISKNNYITLLVCMFTAIIHLTRLKGWYNQQIWQVPLVWVLHVGYFFIIIGFILTALSAFMPYYNFIALHAFSLGVLGIITIGMMARVSIGHTGRNLKFPPNSVKYSFILLVLATIIRLLTPIISPTFYQWSIIISGLLWALAFLLFVYSYTKILITPRFDA